MGSSIRLLQRSAAAASTVRLGNMMPNTYGFIANFAYRDPTGRRRVLQQALG